MLAEFVSKIVSLAQQSEAFQDCRLDRRHETWLFGPGMSEPKVLDDPPPRRGNVFRSLKHFAAALAERAVCPHPEVMVGNNRIEAFTDRHRRRERISMPLTWTAPFGALSTLIPGKKFEVPDLRRWLKTHLEGYMPNEAFLALTALSFSKSHQNHVVSTHGQETLGQEVARSVLNAENIPERFNCTVPVWQEPGCEDRFMVGVLVFLDLEHGQVELVLDEDSFNRAAQDAEEAVRNHLADMLEELESPEIPVWQGSLG